MIREDKLIIQKWKNEGFRRHISSSVVINFPLFYTGDL